MREEERVWDWRGYILKYGPDNSTCRHILLTLSCYMDSAGRSCFPSVDTLVKVTCLSKPTVIKYLKKANRDGWIKTSIKGYSGQGWKRHKYTACLPEKVVKQINRVTEKVVKPVNKGGKPNDKKVVKEVNPNSSGNSSGNSSEGESPDKSTINRIDEAETINTLFEIYREYLKQNNRHPGVFQEEATKHKFKNWGIPKSKKIMIEAISNGWISLKEEYLEGKDEVEAANASAYKNDYTNI